MWPWRRGQPRTSRRPQLHPLRSGRCLLPRSRLLLTCLGELQMMDPLLDITQMTAGRLFDRFERVRHAG